MGQGKTVSLLLLQISIVVRAQFIRNPSTSDLLPFFKASPLFPIARVPVFPPLLSTARVDYGVGLPGGRGKPYDQGCSENRTLQLWDFGVITSPKYPEDYPANSLCEWSLESPEGTRVEATLFDINLQPWFLNYFDSLSLSKDGVFYMVDNYAGDQNEKTPFSVESVGNKFGIRFKSNSILNYRGFKLAYVVKPVDASAVDVYPNGDDGVCGRATYVPPPPTEAPPPATTEVEETTSVPSTAVTVEPENPTTTTTALPVDTHPNGTRIIGENPAQPHSFPWMVAMVIDQKNFCSGSIVDESHVLTAAHCTDKAEQIQLLIGGHNLRAMPGEEPNRILVNVTKENIFTHPKYNMDDILYDIAIIRLPEKLTFSDTITPICLPTRKYVAKTFAKEVVTVAGWGLTEDKGKLSSTLQKVDVEVLENSLCREIFRDKITGNNICTKSTTTASACRGDSGGPLMWKQESVTTGGSPFYSQVGLVSFGAYTCQRGYPVSYTRITSFLDYVSTVTGKQL